MPALGFQGTRPTQATPVVRNGLTVYLDYYNRLSYIGSGTAVKDISGNGNDATYNNGPNNFTIGGIPTWGFNGTNQYFGFSYQIPVQTASTGFTWAAWVYVTRNFDGDILMGLRNNILTFYKQTSNKFEMYPAEVFSPLNIGSWMQVVAVYKGTSGTGGVTGTSGNMRIYRNADTVKDWGGTLDGSTSPQYLRDGDAPSLGASPLNFYIGGDPTAAEYYNAYLNNAQVYNRALTYSEIVDNYNSTCRRFGVAQKPNLYNWTRNLTNVTEGDDYVFTTGSGTWGTGQVYSSEGYTTNVMCSVRPGASGGNQFMLALNSDPTTNSNYTSLDYAWFFNGFGQTSIWESNVDTGIANTYSAADVFTVEYDGSNVVYKKNGTAVRTVARSVGAALYLDTSYNNVCQMIDLKFGRITPA